MAFGGLAIMMFSGHSALSAFNIALRKVDTQSFFFATMFLIVLIVLAYLTNPSETSFRAYLTEQTFRQHLRRLDDDNQDDQPEREDHGVHYTLARRPISSIHHKPAHRSYDPSPPFHFVNRASVSLRTPKHVFHSVGILTVAAIVPTSTKSQSLSRDASKPDHHSPSMLSDSWFIGAFGKWWRAGSIHPGWLETMVNAKDAERCNSGILDVKSLHNLEVYDGLPHFNHLGNPVSRDPIPSSPSNFNRDISRSTIPSLQNGNTTHRSLTPPPLPKSASLPLHAPRVPSSASAPSKASASSSSLALIPTSPPLQSSTSSSFDQSPIIAEILRQISRSEVAVYDLRSQLNDFRSAAAVSHKSIQDDLEMQRERKRTEDATKVELRTRTKALEDSKRSADAVKREAEKKLRAAESARDSASERIGRLDKEIEVLKGKMGEDEKEMKACVEEGDREERKVMEELEIKKKEIKVAEDVVAALNARAKELEEKIAREEERLRLAKEQAEMRKQDRDFFPLHVVTPDTAIPPIAPWTVVGPTTIQDPHTFIHSDLSGPVDVFSQSSHLPQTRSRGGSYSSGSRGTSDHSSPRPRKLSLGGLSNFRGQPGVIGAEVSNGQLASHSNGFSGYGDKLPDLSLSTRFSPFDNIEVESPLQGLADSTGVDSPKSSSLIPTSLIQSLEANGGTEDISRSFQSEDDDFLDRNWRKMHPFPAHPVESPSVYSSSPTSLTNPSFDGIDREDPFEIRPPPAALRHRITSDISDMQRFLNPIRSSSDPQSLGGLPHIEDARAVEEKGVAALGHRRWFSSPKAPQTHQQHEKKGLNPEAKAFQLPKSFAFPPMFHTIPKRHSPFESDQHHGLVNTTGSSPSLVNSSPNSNHSPSNMNVVVSSMLPPPPSSLPSHSSGATDYFDMESLFSTLSMRAFAPSPAEREALNRGLGSSSNASLERLPTLSEVSTMGSSMPPSPSSGVGVVVNATHHNHPVHNHHNHGHHPLPLPHPHQQHLLHHSQQQREQPPAGSMGSAARTTGGLPPGLAWLHSFPRMKKPSKFSPWDDGEDDTDDRVHDGHQGNGTVNVNNGGTIGLGPVLGRGGAVSSLMSDDLEVGENEEDQGSSSNAVGKVFLK